MKFKKAATLAAIPIAGLLVYVSFWLTQGVSPASRQHPDDLASTGVGTPALPQGPERCVQCHPGGSPPDRHHAEIACTSCHLGDATSFEEAIAHEGMEAEPGALDTAFQTCGRSGCHTEETTRVAGSIMATARGIISVNRFAWGEIPNPDGAQTMDSLLAQGSVSPAENYTRKLCGGCHLGARRENRDDAIVTGGSGCGACHSAGGARVGVTHQAIDAVPSDERCLGCHSRSGRISLSYQGLAEVTGVDCESPQQLFDGRAGCRLEEDVHHAAGLACVDCHLHTELMGDGESHQHKEQQTELSCQSCHGPSERQTTWGSIKDPLSARLLALRGESRPKDEPVRTGEHGTPLWNLRPSDSGWVLHSKSDERTWNVTATPQDATHSLVGHERLECSSCHAEWAPVCADCHVDYDPQMTQWDFALKANNSGGFRESTNHQGWGRPALAVVDESHIAPAVPGMIMTATKSAGSKVQQRLYAALDPHTTNRQGRSCSECHNDAFALGLGTGRIDSDSSGTRMVAASPDAQGLAPDRWTSLESPQSAQGTRTGVRSLSPAELKRVLAVGTCLECHSDATDPIYENFREALGQVGQGACLGTAFRF